jgi:hypothetical protein
MESPKLLRGVGGSRAWIPANQSLQLVDYCHPSISVTDETDADDIKLLIYSEQLQAQSTIPDTVLF